MHQNGNDYVYDITKIDKKKKVQPKSQNSEATGNETATPSNQKVTQAESKVNTKGVKLQIADEDSEGSKLTEEQQEFFTNTTLQIWRVVQQRRGFVLWCKSEQSDLYRSKKEPGNHEAAWTAIVLTSHEP